jgi:hypothetical protein
MTKIVVSLGPQLSRVWVDVNAQGASSRAVGVIPLSRDEKNPKAVQNKQTHFRSLVAWWPSH